MNDRQRDRGSALIEFALSFAFLFATLAGAFQFGYSYQTYSALETSVRAAARYASMRTWDSATATPSDGYLAAVRNVAVYGDPDGIGQPAAVNLATSNVEVTMALDRGMPSVVKVAIVNYEIDAVFTAFTLRGKPAASFPFLGRYAPPV